ncbi:MAG: hypothetical protein ACJ8AT_20400 [Hyalangium sp.]|uniref:hypothetical protein n=1 Tax=Hyalangium sp. TaxID=2028555 RepID=UPI00389AEA92
MRGVLLLLVTLTTSVAFAQYDDEGPPKLEGTNRISVVGGWRYAPNFTFYNNYYSNPDHQGLPRSRGSFGGPALTATFGYSVTNLIEVGADLFASYERLALTGKPGLNTVTYGAMLGLRFQKRFELGPAGLIPAVGLLAGPHIAAAYFDGGRAVENGGTAFGLTAGATLRLNPTWGVCFELREIFARGEVEDVGYYNAGGTWLAVGLTYILPWEPDRRINGRL